MCQHPGINVQDTPDLSSPKTCQRSTQVQDTTLFALHFDLSPHIMHGIVHGSLIAHESL